MDAIQCRHPGSKTRQNTVNILPQIVVQGTICSSNPQERLQRETFALSFWFVLGAIFIFLDVIRYRKKSPGIEGDYPTASNSAICTVLEN